MTPDLAFWGRLFAVLALEITLVIVLSGAITPRLRCASHRRAAWLAGLWAVAFLVFGELAGVRSWVTGGSAVPSESRRAAAWIADGDRAPLPSAAPSPATPAKAALHASAGAAWWPGITWFAGTILVAGYRAFGHGMLLRRRRLGTSADPELAATIRPLATRLRLGPVRVSVWPELRSPIAFGFRRGWVAVPSQFTTRFEPLQRDAILLHELAHLAARDPLAQAFAGLVGALVWWHPAVWWAQRRLQAEMEAAADDASALVPGGRTALAESLVQLGREWVTGTPSQGLGVAGASSGSRLAGRVRALLTSATGWRRPTLMGRCLGVSSAGLLAFGLLTPAWPGTGTASLAERLLASKAQGGQAPVPAFASGPGSEAPSRPPESGPSASIPRLPPDAETPTERAHAAVVSDEKSSPTPQLPLREPATAPPAPEPLRQGPGSAPGHPSSIPPRERASEAPDPTAERPVVTLEVKFLEVTERGGEDLGLDWLFGQTSTPSESLTVVIPSADQPGAGSPGAANFRLEHGRTTNQVAVLSSDQLKALLRRLEARGGCEILAAPRVSAASGQQAQVQVQEVRTLVTQAEALHGQGTNAPSIHYLTETVALGPSVDVIPTWGDSVWTITVLAAVSEFLGYDDPQGTVLEARNEAGESLYGQTPLPRLRVRETIGEGALADDQTLILRGPAAERTQKIKRGWFRAARTEVQRKRLYILVTAVPSA